MFITIASLVVHMAFLQRIITPSSSPAIILYRVYVRNSGIHKALNINKLWKTNGFLYIEGLFGSRSTATSTGSDQVDSFVGNINFRQW